VVRGFSTALGITVRLAGLHNLGRLTSGALELEGDLPLASLSPRLLASITLSAAWSSPFSGTAFDRVGATPFTGSAFFTSLFVGPRWTAYEDEQAHLYVGGGVDAHLVRALLSHLGSTPLSGFALGAHLRLGGGYALGPGLLMSQVRVSLTPVIPVRVPVAGQLSGVAVSFGYRLPL